MNQVNPPKATMVPSEWNGTEQEIRFSRTLDESDLLWHASIGAGLCQKDDRLGRLALGEEQRPLSPLARPPFE